MGNFKHESIDLGYSDMVANTTDTGRKYAAPNGVKYPSITTVLGILSVDGIMKWRKRVGEEEANKISHQAATRGTSVHKLAEDYIDNVDDWKGKALPNNLYTFSHLKDIIDSRLNNVWFQEEYLYSDRLKCAGQVDCIAEFDGELSIIDFKTSRKPKKIEWITNYFIQASFYAAAFYERTGVPIKQGVILITVDHNEPQVFKINTHDYLQQFLDVRQKYKELKENG